ncbi:hypothetical protein PoB_000569900 [Plakobranchus ocellatus]|uniref:Uncharacterized protein n=1 Tax=Plakobranchus ocellatus TaxID=259542 RepID=A0AAV3YAU3_9GAST|nr:hypothetical protein PoB_000569900 [Plakobranchus ocellatus]
MNQFVEKDAENVLRDSMAKAAIEEFETGDHSDETELRDGDVSVGENATKGIRSIPGGEESKTKCQEELE